MPPTPGPSDRANSSSCSPPARASRDSLSSSSTQDEVLIFNTARPLCRRLPLTEPSRRSRWSAASARTTGCNSPASARRQRTRAHREFARARGTRRHLVLQLPLLPLRVLLRRRRQVLEFALELAQGAAHDELLRLQRPRVLARLLDARRPRRRALALLRRRRPLLRLVVEVLDVRGEQRVERRAPPRSRAAWSAPNCRAPPPAAAPPSARTRAATAG